MITKRTSKKGVAGSGLTQRELKELKKVSKRFEADGIKPKIRKFEGSIKDFLDTIDSMKMGPDKRSEKQKIQDFKDSLLSEPATGKEGGLAEATAKLKAKGFKDGGMVVKDKTVSIDTSPNSGLITVKGFGAGRKT